MANTLQSFLAAQDAAVIDNFIDDDWCIAAATSAPALAELAARRGRSVHSLGSIDRDQACVVRHGGHAELWVKARRSGYVDLFLAFAGQERGFTPGGLPGGYNVDHLFSRGRVQTPSGLQDDRLPVTTLVLMLLVAAPVNKSFGGLMEGAMVGSGNPARPYRRFDWLQLAKALSIDANMHGSGFGGAEVITNMAHVVDEMELRGICAAFPISREQLASQLLQRAETVMHYRHA